mgnify:CR=1 FL=1
MNKLPAKKPTKEESYSVAKKIVGLIKNDVRSRIISKIKPKRYYYAYFLGLGSMVWLRCSKLIFVKR